MNLNFLNKKGNNDLIIFFNGWGMDDGIVSHLEFDNYDVLTVCDYNSLTPLPDLSKYKAKHVIAWSMGVKAAALYDSLEPVSATAVNGTPYPVNAEYGINPKVYKLMESGFDDSSKNKFIAKMFDAIPSNFIAPARETQNLKSELTALRNYPSNADYKYTRVIVSNNDKIIPTCAQLNWWKDPEIIDAGHCPFYRYNSWKELL